LGGARREGQGGGREDGARMEGCGGLVLAKGLARTPNRSVGGGRDLGGGKIRGEGRFGGRAKSGGVRSRDWPAAAMTRIRRGGGRLRFQTLHRPTLRHNLHPRICRLPHPKCLPLHQAAAAMQFPVPPSTPSQNLIFHHRATEFNSREFPKERRARAGRRPFRIIAER